MIFCDFPFAQTHCRPITSHILYSDWRLYAQRHRRFAWLRLSTSSPLFWEQSWKDPLFLWYLSNAVFLRCLTVRLGCFRKKRLSKIHSLCCGRLRLKNHCQLPYQLFRSHQGFCWFWWGWRWRSKAYSFLKITTREIVASRNCYPSRRVSHLRPKPSNGTLLPLFFWHFSNAAK